VFNSWAQRIQLGNIDIYTLQFRRKFIIGSDIVLFGVFLSTKSANTASYV